MEVSGMIDEEKYKEFVNIICEMSGFNKPIDILKVCQITSDFIKSYEMKIKDLEQVNKQLKIDNYHLDSNLQRISDMHDEAKNTIDKLEEENQQLKQQLENEKQLNAENKEKTC